MFFLFYKVHEVSPLFDRYEGGELAVLVHVFFSQEKDIDDLQEFESLVTSAGVKPVQIITGSRRAPHSKYYVGKVKRKKSQKQ